MTERAALESVPHHNDIYRMHICTMHHSCERMLKEYLPAHVLHTQSSAAIDINDVKLVCPLLCLSPAGARFVFLSPLDTPS